MQSKTARKILAETSEETKAKVKQYAKKMLAEHLFDPDKYGNWLTGEPKGNWGPSRDPAIKVYIKRIPK